MNWRIERAPKGEPPGIGLALTLGEVIVILWNRAYIWEFRG